MSELHFQYCPKLAVFSRDRSNVLLCRRKGEMDYDGVFSFIGGKMEHKDADIVDALRREKNEEVGDHFRVRVLTLYSIDVLFRKKDGNHMILPHFYAEHLEGAPTLSDEYSEYVWASVADLASRQPIIANIPWIVPALLRVAAIAPDDAFASI